MRNPLRRKTILFVCTGNTCRSPMAVSLYRKSLSWWRRWQYKVLSAGISTNGNKLASDYAVAVMQSKGIDISGHRSRKLTPELARSASIVYCMTGSHERSVRMICPEANTEPLCPFSDIPDPFGCNLERYQQVASAIEAAVRFRLKLIPDADYLPYLEST